MRRGSCAVVISHSTSSVFHAGGGTSFSLITEKQLHNMMAMSNYFFDKAKMWCKVRHVQQSGGWHENRKPNFVRPWLSQARAGYSSFSCLHRQAGEHFNSMIKYKSIIVALALCAGLTGCANLNGVPGTKIAVGGASGFFPKQFNATNVTITISQGGGTNFVFHADAMSSQNDPQVIDKSSAGQVAIVKAYMDGLNQLTSAAVQGAVMGAK